MSKVVDTFLKMTQGKNPRFLRKRADGGDIELKHLPEPPPAAAALKKFGARLEGYAPELLELYQHFDGGRFFADATDIEQCFYFLPIGRMASSKRNLEDWLFMRTNDGDEYAEEIDEKERINLYGAPPWWKSAIVFAGFGYAPERLYLAPQGPHVGKIFLYEHDSDVSINVAADMKELLIKICSKPAEFVEAYGTGVYYLQGYRAGAS